MRLPTLVKAPLRRWLGRFLPLREPYERVDFAPHELEVLSAIAPYTMTTAERVIGPVRAVEHLVQNGIEGQSPSAACIAAARPRSIGGRPVPIAIG